MIQVSVCRLAALMAVGSFMAGCASQSTTSGTTAAVRTSPSDKVEKLVENRALERWNLLIAHDAEKAYDYLSPGYRATKKRDDYAKEMNDRPVQWKKVLPYSQACDKPDVCIVNMQVDSTVKMPGVGKTVPTVGFVTETWILSRGKWYFLPDSRKVTGRK